MSHRRGAPWLAVGAFIYTLFLLCACGGLAWAALDEPVIDADEVLFFGSFVVGGVLWTLFAAAPFLSARRSRPWALPLARGRAIVSALAAPSLVAGGVGIVLLSFFSLGGGHAEPTLITLAGVLVAIFGLAAEVSLGVGAILLGRELRGGLSDPP